MEKLHLRYIHGFRLASVLSFVLSSYCLYLTIALCIAHGINNNLMFLLFTACISPVFLYCGLFFLLVRIDFDIESISQINPILRKTVTIRFDEIQKYTIIKSFKAGYWLHTICKDGKRKKIVFDRDRLFELFTKEMKKRDIQEMNSNSLL